MPPNRFLKNEIVLALVKFVNSGIVPLRWFECRARITNEVGRSAAVSVLVRPLLCNASTQSDLNERNGVIVPLSALLNKPNNVIAVSLERSGLIVPLTTVLDKPNCVTAVSLESSGLIVPLSALMDK